MKIASQLNSAEALLLYSLMCRNFILFCIQGDAAALFLVEILYLNIDYLVKIKCLSVIAFVCVNNLQHNCKNGVLKIAFCFTKVKCWITPFQFANERE